jgi:hypothetical protein
MQIFVTHLTEPLSDMRLQKYLKSTNDTRKQEKHLGGYIVNVLGFFRKFPACLIRFKR